MFHGQIVIGPPGSGKTTYCAGMSQFLEAQGRETLIVNLDPANHILPYRCDININSLITLADVMDHFKLGPNGALIYCMEYLEKNCDWLKVQIKKSKAKYVLFDFPGQVELYTHNNSVKKLLTSLHKDGFNLVAVHLVDSHYCNDVGKFVSVLLTSLSTMLQVELPQVNVLSKADLIEQYGKLAFNLDFYTEVLDLNYLLEHLQDDPVFQKYRRMNKALIEVIQDYSLVSFVMLNIEDKESVLRVLKQVDKANGYEFDTMEECGNICSMLSCAVGAERQETSLVQEKYMDT